MVLLCHKKYCHLKYLVAFKICFLCLKKTKQNTHTYKDIFLGAREMAQIVNYTHVNLFNPQYQHKSLALAVIPALKGRRSPGLASQSTKISEFQGSGKPYFKNKTEFFFLCCNQGCVCICILAFTPSTSRYKYPQDSRHYLYEVREEPEKNQNLYPCVAPFSWSVSIHYLLL